MQELYSHSKACSTLVLSLYSQHIQRVFTPIYQELMNCQGSSVPSAGVLNIHEVKIVLLLVQVCVIFFPEIRTPLQGVYYR